MNKEQFLSSGLLEQYVLGITSSEERRKVEYYLEQWPDLKDEVHKMRSAIEDYAMKQAIPPPPHLKDQILNELSSQKTAQGSQAELGRRRGVGAQVFTGLAVMAALVASLLAFIFYTGKQNTQHAYNRLQNEFQALKESCESDRRAQQEMEKVFAFLSHGATQPVTLQGTRSEYQNGIIAYWNEENKAAYLSLTNLPPAPEDKQYQVWADVEGEMINVGLIKPGQEESFQPIAYLPEAESLNITIEPNGGSEEPTIENLVLNGKIS